MISVTAPESATQRATWTHRASEGSYMAAVTRTSRKDERGATGWAWELSFSPADGVGFHYTGAETAQLIYAPMTDDPREVLETLASFVGAWDEAQRYSGSENLGLFLRSCLDFLGASDEFQADTMSEEEE